jgi:hypothetical protein
MLSQISFVSRRKISHFKNSLLTSHHTLFLSSSPIILKSLQFSQAPPISQALNNNMVTQTKKKQAEARKKKEAAANYAKKNAEEEATATIANPTPVPDANPAVSTTTTNAAQTTTTAASTTTTAAAGEGGPANIALAAAAGGRGPPCTEESQRSQPTTYGLVFIFRSYFADSFSYTSVNLC